MQETDRVIAGQRIALQEMRSGAFATWENIRPILEGRGSGAVKDEDVIPFIRVTETSPCLMPAPPAPSFVFSHPPAHLPFSDES